MSNSDTKAGTEPARALQAAIIDSSADAIVTRDLEGVISSWNRAAERFFGYRAEEAIGQAASMIVPASLAVEEAGIGDRVIKGERIESYDTLRRRKDGTEVEVWLSVSGLRDDDGRLFGIVEIARRGDPQFGYSEKSSSSEERFRVTLGSIGDAVLATDPVGRITFVNPVAEKLMGRMEAEILGKPLKDVMQLVNERTRVAVENPVEKVLVEGRTVGLANHTVLVRADGSECAIEDSAAPIRSADGTLMGVVLVFRDTTEQRRAALMAQKLAAIVESSDDGIISKSLEGIIQSWNTGAERIFGYHREEIVGKPITMLIPPELQSEEVEILSRLRRGKRIDHYETTRVAKDGRRVEVSLTISPIRDPSGVIVGASKIARDITERKRTERALEEAHQQLEGYARELEARVRERTSKLEEMVAELEGFSYSMSHDLRAPLRAMTQYSQIVLQEQGEKLNNEGKYYLGRIVAAATRLDTLICDVLSYSSVVRTPAPLTRIDMEKLILDVASVYPTLRADGAQIEIAAPLSPMLGHEAFLTQVMTNLLSNAVKFKRSGSAVRVRVWTESKGKTVRLWVEDNGIGISEKDRTKIFGMFERLHTEAEYQGTGIGLAIVRKAMERMNGRVGVESELGKGSRFWIELGAAD